MYCGQAKCNSVASANELHAHGNNYGNNNNYGNSVKVHPQLVPNVITL